MQLSHLLQDQAWRLIPWLENPRASFTVCVVDVCMHGVRVHVDTGGEHGCPPRWLEVWSDLTEFMLQPHCLASQPASRDCL